MRNHRIVALLIAFFFSFNCLVLTGIQDSYAASKSKVYVLTKMDVENYEDEYEDEYEEDSFIDTSNVVFSVSYDKNGLAKTGTLSTDGGDLKQKTKIAYKSKFKLKSCKMTTSYLGMKVSSTSKKFTVNSKGIVTKYKVYNEKGKLADVYKLTWNKNNRVTKERKYSAKGKLRETTIYLYNPDGTRNDTKVYSAEGNLESRMTYEYKEDMYIVHEYDSEGKQISTTFIKCDENGNRISQDEYDTDGNLITSAKFTYKLVNTTKEKAVKGQQEILEDIAI